MGRLPGLSEILVGGAIVLVASSQPAQAAVTEVTSVQLNQTSNGVDVVLITQNGDRPQIFPINRGNDLIAEITDTQLQLAEGNAFRRDNPGPGIAAVVVEQLESNSIRVTVSGADRPLEGRITQQSPDEIAFRVSTESTVEPANQRASVFLANPSAQATPSDNTPVIETANPDPSLPVLSDADPSQANQIPTVQPDSAPTTVAQVSRQPVQERQRPQSRQRPPQSRPRAQTQSTPRSQSTQQSQDVLVPNPEVTIDGIPAQPLGTSRPISPTPPLLPRAIAPPVGDIAISTVNSLPATIDLGSVERIPRLVLRDAPVREVLSLLARAAGMNIAYIGELPITGSDLRDQARRARGDEIPEPTVTLDIENESVQDVFNYVLRITGMEANRVGRTIFVGPQLPDEARNVMVRSLRLNQVPVTTAANFLSAQGAITQLPIERVRIEAVGEPGFRRLIESRQPDIIPLGAEEGEGPLLLRGLSILTNERLNSITLVGTPRKIQMATSFLQQLDARRRQVAVNVKIIDVNLSGNEQFTTSFSFGSGNSFFVQDQGTAIFTFGGARPPSAAETNNSTLSPTIVNAPFPTNASSPFLDAQPDAPFGQTSPQPFGSPTLNDGETQTPGGIAVRPPFGSFENPLQPGVTQIQQGNIQFGLPEIFQFPRRFLSRLQAQIVSRDAKILTDPTLIVQEGETASVNLTEEVVGNRTSTFTDTAGVQRETVTITKEDVGLQLAVAVDRIDDNGFISLRVTPQVSAPIGQVDTGGGNFITLIQQRAVTSGQIRLRDGQTLILTGIIQDQDITTVTKVPILGDIPLLGALFRNTSRQNQRNEVVVLLTPNILDDSERSTFGYGYVPGDKTREILQRNGAFDGNQR